MECFKWILLYFIVLNQQLCICLAASPSSDLNCDFVKSFGLYDRHSPEGMPGWEKNYGSVLNMDRSRKVLQHYASVNYTSDIVSNMDNVAHLTSPPVTIEEDTCLYFDYRNDVNPKGGFNAEKVGNTSLRILYKRESEWVILKSFIHTLSSGWYSGEVQLPLGTYRISFSGEIHNQMYKMVGIADIFTQAGVCGFGKTEERREGDCLFEDISDCGYSYTPEGDLHWSVVNSDSLNALLQPSWGRYTLQRNRLPSGSFLAIGYYHFSDEIKDRRARLVSPNINLASEGCLSFSYHNDIFPVRGNTSNALNIYINQSGLEKLHYRALRTPNGDWKRIRLSLEAGNFSIIFEGKLAEKSDLSSYYYVGLDNVEIFHQPCAEVEKMVPICYKQKPELCSNGGICYSTRKQGLKAFDCICRNGYFGRRCEIQNPCVASDKTLCHNGGTCQIINKSKYKCLCTAEYYGEKCEQIQKCETPKDDIVPNGYIYNMTGVMQDSKGYIACNSKEFNITGNGFITCKMLQTGKLEWVTTTQCTLISCGNLSPRTDSHVRREFISNSTYGGKAKYSCADGYGMSTEMEENDFIFHCTEYGIWAQKSKMEKSSTSQKNKVTRPIKRLTCTKLPQCSRPPEIDHGFTTHFNFSVGGTAEYGCVKGYRLKGGKYAVCLKDKYSYQFYWEFIPKCEKYCTVPVGESGSKSVAKIKTQVCNSTSFEPYDISSLCDNPRVFVVGKDTGSDRSNMIYYGEEVCFSLNTIYTKKVRCHDDRRGYGYNDYKTCYSKTIEECKPFCLSRKNRLKIIDMEYILTYTKANGGVNITVKRMTAEYRLL